ncbi:phosphotransferase [Streptomyces sp. NPDC006012]|uniref:phosphotransferase n=1 Tax=Streptomyces sp. NPDC006012 TaxID=3364739 RepID=UPI0036CCB543
MTAPLLPQLAARLREAAHPGGEPCGCGAAVTLAERPDATVLLHADVVAKAHAPDTDPAGLAFRLATAARVPDVFVPPLGTAPATLGDRLATLWPYGTPVDPDTPDDAPWEAAGDLLARLHRTPADVAVPARLHRTSEAAAVPGPPCPAPAPPPMRGPRKAARAITRLRTALTHADTPAAPPVLRAWAALPGWARGTSPMPGPAVLCHGDLHLGQLVRYPAPDGPWRLIDVDDLGVGVPAWDLARPAAWYACGLLAPDEWTRFLGAYRAAGGPAVPARADPWPALDVPARALTVQTAALAITKARAADRPLDEAERALIDACARMECAPPELTPGFPK